MTPVLLAMQDSWYRRAQLALNKGEEELAREALRRRKTFTDAEAALQKQLDQHTRATQQLLGNIRYGGLVCKPLLPPAHAPLVKLQRY